MSLVELSESVGLSQTPCKRRLKRLEEAGLIAGYRARSDRKAAGCGITAFVSVEEVVTGSLMTGAQDFLLEVVVASLEEFESFLQTKLLRLEGIRAVRSRFALRRFVDRARIP